MKSAPFSFHCGICIEPFNLIDRPPVVLPCGHTYICEQCSKRITKCTECRTSLFVRPQPLQSADIYMGNSYALQSLSPGTPVSRRKEYLLAQRYGQSPSAPKRPPPPERIPLPLPRNLVLIALMEASARRLHPIANLMDDNDSECSIPDDDREIVLSSIHALSSSSGTYAIRERYGLPVYSSMDGRMKPNKPIKLLNYGQKVQIIDVQDGVYKLARSKGVIFANSAQLVKVGPAREKSCKVGGILNSIQSRKEDLTQQLNELKKSEAKLKSQLKKLLAEQPEYPIIEECDEEQMEINRRSHEVEVMEDQENRHQQRSTPSEKYLSSANSHATFISDESFGNTTPTPATPPSLATPGTPGTQKSIMFDDSMTTTTTQSLSPFRSGIMCGSSLIPLFRKYDDDDDGDSLRARIPIRQVDSDDLSGSNFETIDFRTGFSGHIALNRARRNVVHQKRSEIRMMGEHRGIAPIKNMRKNGPSSPLSEKKSW